jgi:CRISPR-associated exonuclease Cas4
LSRWREEELLPISALQHFVFCPRQAALIHLEAAWRENRRTAEGRVLHERADLPGGEDRRGIRVLRAVTLFSERLGAHGRADVVELRPGPDGRAAPYPVEMKRGRRSDRLADRVQLCAQAMALEETFGVPVGEGAIFYAATHRRVQVALDEALRAETAGVAERLRAMLAARVVPRVGPDGRCGQCSLRPDCLPEVTRPGVRASRWLADKVAEAAAEVETG